MKVEVRVGAGWGTWCGENPGITQTSGWSPLSPRALPLLNSQPLQGASALGLKRSSMCGPLNLYLAQHQACQ